MEQPISTVPARTVSRAPRRTGRRGLVCAATVAVLAVVSGAVVSAPVAAQESAASEAEVRIVARKLENGRIEFGLQQRQSDATWGERQLPRIRFFPTTVGVGRWLASSVLNLPAGEVRIVARKLENGKIEFGLQQRQTNDSWGDRQLPRIRFFPTTAGVGRWLASSPLTLAAPSAALRFSTVSAGMQHTCGLRTDATIECWGNNERGQLDAPSGAFSAVSTGYHHSCGLRTDSTIACWGLNEDGQTDVPAGEFSAVTAGFQHTCGLRTDATIECWGSNWTSVGGYLGRIDPPAGRFIAVAAGADHSCGLRTDGAITCWGFNIPEVTDAPALFSAVTTGYRNTCGLRTDAIIECSGTDDVITSPPAGQFSAVTALWHHSCALRTDGTVACWGYDEAGRMDAPASRFSAVTAGGYHSCGLRTDGTVACWGANWFGQADVPTQHAVTPGGDQRDSGSGREDTTRPPSTESASSVRFTAVTARRDHTCGLQTDGIIACWGANSEGQTDVPDGSFTAVAAGNIHSCGLRTDGTVACWGTREPWSAAVPDGRFTSISADVNSGCGVRTDATIACWSDEQHLKLNAPTGQFSAVTTGWNHTCGLRTDATIACWDGNNYGQLNAPSGQFAAVAAGGEHICGLRIDGTIACWGANGQGQTDVPAEPARAPSGEKADSGDAESPDAGATDSGERTGDSKEDDGRPQQPGDVGGGSPDPEEPSDPTPGRPRNLRVELVDGQGLRITWDEPADDGGSAVTGYTVRVSHPRWSSSVGPSNRSFEQRRRSLEFLRVLFGLRYEITVWAQNRDGRGESAKSQITPCPVAGKFQVRSDRRVSALADFRRVINSSHRRALSAQGEPPRDAPEPPAAPSGIQRAKRAAHRAQRRR